MSGGSYNYLFLKGSMDMPSEDLSKMRSRLEELGFKDIAQSVTNIFDKYEQIDGSLEKLSGILAAVEWLDSGDSGLDYLEEEVKKYRST